MAYRVLLDMGSECNNNCIFCVVADGRNMPNMATEEAKDQMYQARENGANEVVLTGGEPTIRKDLIEIVKYARDIGYTLIQLQTNARMLSYKEYVDKLVKAGVNEFVPAIHAHTAELHDYITQVKGSFNETYQAIKNIREYDVYLITNTVLSKLNYKVLPEIARMVIDLKVDQFQFACVHPLGNAWNYYDEVVPNFSEIQPYVHKAIDIGKEANVDVRVEAIPFCFMQGYEKYVSELYIPKTMIKEKMYTSNN